MIKIDQNSSKQIEIIKMVIKMAGMQSKQIEIANSIEIANKLTLGMACVKHIEKDILASMPTCLLHLPGRKRCAIHLSQHLKWCQSGSLAVLSAIGLGLGFGSELRSEAKHQSSLLSMVRDWDVWWRTDHVSTICHQVLTSSSDRQTQQKHF